ncbi:hypothetical protein GE21DRAFT_1273514 [Neurospora crassa]|nr:hypothetical protein GE21DRAFT_1273514 [Neurospora crassa]
MEVPGTCPKAQTTTSSQGIGTAGWPLPESPSEVLSDCRRVRAPQPEPQRRPIRVHPASESSKATSSVGWFDSLCPPVDSRSVHRHKSTITVSALLPRPVCSVETQATDVGRNRSQSITSFGSTSPQSTTFANPSGSLSIFVRLPSLVQHRREPKSSYQTDVSLPLTQLQISIAIHPAVYPSSGLLASSRPAHYE